MKNKNLINWTSQKLKTVATTWEKIFASHISEKGLISKVFFKENNSQN